MKKILTIILFLCMLVFAFGCQSISGSSETTSSQSSESSIVSSEECVSWAPMPFDSIDDLINHLRHCRNAVSIQGVDIQNFIEDGTVILYVPTFTLPKGYRLNGLDLHYANCTYYYHTDEWINSHEQMLSSQFAAASAAAQSRSFPISSYETMVESSVPYGEPLTSSEQAILHAQQQAEEKFVADNRITIVWYTEKSENPLAWVLEDASYKPLGGSENPKCYYKEQVRYNEIWAYDVYWSLNGYRFYAYIPAALFTQEFVAEICSMTPVTAPCYD